MRSTLRPLIWAGLLMLGAFSAQAQSWEPIPREHDDPVSVWQARIDADCISGWKDDLETPGAPKISRGKGVFGPTFAVLRDMNGDGLPDVIMNIDDSTCEGGRNGGWCGSAGCTTGIWFARPEGGYRRALETNIQAFEVVEYVGSPALRFRWHGIVCGRAGSDGCVDIRVWDGAELQTVWANYWDARRFGR